MVLRWGLGKIGSMEPSEGARESDDGAIYRRRRSPTRKSTPTQIATVPPFSLLDRMIFFNQFSINNSDLAH